MWRPVISLRSLWSLLLLSATAGCPDYLTGQDGEPPGPLLVARLTLFDTARPTPVFTDTSVPNCSDPANQSTLNCSADPNGDSYSPQKSPPDTDSGMEMRAVFNKVPIHLGGGDTETVHPDGSLTTDQTSASLACTGCTGPPPTVKTLIYTGSTYTFDPTYPGSGFPGSQVPYGPNILLQVDPADPKASLEPQTSYSVTLNTGLADRNGNGLQLDPAAQALLRFTVMEPFRVLRAGIGDPKGDTWASGSSFMLASLPANGAVQIFLNAPVDEAALGANAVSGTVNGVMVPARIILSKRARAKDMSISCAPDAQQRYLRVVPSGGSWGARGAMLTITVDGTQVRDVSQAAGHPAMMGRHTLGGALTVTATLADPASKTDMTPYKGLVFNPMMGAPDCPGTVDLF